MCYKFLWLSLITQKLINETFQISYPPQYRPTVPHTAPYGVKNGHMLFRPEMVVKSSKIVSEESYHKKQHILGKNIFFWIFREFFFCIGSPLSKWLKIAKKWLVLISLRHRHLPVTWNFFEPLKKMLLDDAWYWDLLGIGYFFEKTVLYNRNLIQVISSNKISSKIKTINLTLHITIRHFKILQNPLKNCYKRLKTVKNGRKHCQK